MVDGYSIGERAKDGDVNPSESLGLLAWFEHPKVNLNEWKRHNISRRKRGMFDKLLARDMDNDGDIDFISTRGNSYPYYGVFWLEQVRTANAKQVFEKARTLDSEEMPLSN
jgi:hypothetical protein